MFRRSGYRLAGNNMRHSRNLAATRGASGRAADGRLGLHRQEALALHFLAGELAGAANRFRPFPGLLFGGFFIVAAQLHFAENALALHLLLERLEGLVDIIVSDENLHARSSPKDRV